MAQPRTTNTQIATTKVNFLCHHLRVTLTHLGGFLLLHNERQSFVGFKGVKTGHAALQENDF